jgi:hypothetical protein
MPTEGQGEPERARKVFAPPALTRYGDVHRITMCSDGTGGSPPDGGHGHGGGHHWGHGPGGWPGQGHGRR